MISFEKRQRAQRAAACVGVDAGKYAHTLVVRPQDQPDSKPLSFDTTAPGFEGALGFITEAARGAAPPDILVGIEFAGNYGFTFAHYLHQRGYQVVSVLPAHTKKWKEVAHNQPLKTDAKDAGTITDLVAQGQFVRFPFLEAPYARLRYLVAARERLSLLRRRAITQLRTLLQVVFPEFETLFQDVARPTARALLKAYPTPGELLTVNRWPVLRILKKTSRGHVREDAYLRLIEAAKGTLGLPSAQSCLRSEILFTLERLTMYQRQIGGIEKEMVAALDAVPETPFLRSIPKVAPVTIAAFLGSIGDPRAYDSNRQVLKVAGLSLVEHSSGIRKGTHRISKRGRPLLRQAAYMLAIRHIRQDGLYRAKYEALLSRNGEKKLKAVVAVMREVLRLLFAIARDRRTFTVEPPAPVRQAAQEVA